MVTLRVGSKLKVIYHCRQTAMGRSRGVGMLK